MLGPTDDSGGHPFFSKRVGLPSPSAATMPRLSLLARRLRLPCPQSPPSTTHPRLLSSPTPSGAGWASHDLLTGSCGPPAAFASDSESPVVFSTEGGQEEDESDGVLERLGRGAEIYRGPGCAILSEWKRYLRKPQTKAYMEVDYISKFVAVAEIIATLRPSVLYLAVHNINVKPDFRSMIAESIGTKIDDEIVRGNCTILCFTIDVESYPLLIVFDATLPKETYNSVGCFTIFLPYSSERELLPAGTEELSALSYVYFNGAMKIRENEPRK